MSFAYVLLLAAFPADARDENVLYESPSGGLKVVEETEDVVAVIFVKNPQLHFPLPKEGLNLADEFHASPDAQWLFGLRHEGSGLRDGSLYHLLGTTKVEELKKATPFSQLAWKAGVKLGALKRNFADEGLYAMTFFGGWSLDSARLLVRLGGGEAKRDFTYRYLYFNTRTQAFELTDYLRKLNKSANEPLGCAESASPLPESSELKKLADASDAELNRVYRKKMAGLEQNAATELRGEQRDWLKQRDAGLPIYVSSFPAEEKEARRLQFLATVTAARIDQLRQSRP